METKIIVLCGYIKEDKILLLRRKKEPFKSLLGLPGGKMQYGETIEDAGVREFLEETGIKTTCRCIAGINNEILMMQNSESKKFDRVYHLLIFVVELVGKETNWKGSDEGDLEWVSLKDLDSLPLIPSDSVMTKNFFLKNMKIS